MGGDLIYHVGSQAKQAGWTKRNIATQSDCGKFQFLIVEVSMPSASGLTTLDASPP